MSTGELMRPATSPPMTLKQHLQSPALIAELGKAMPAHCKPERMARVAITALTRTPKLADCTPASFFECMMSLSQWGLEPDGRRAHLIPYGNKCTLIIDYKGYVELAYRSGVVKNIHADVVHEGDIFEYSTGRVLKHTPWFLRRDEDRPAGQGDIFAVYCQIELTGDTVKTEVLSKQDVEGIRKRSRAGNSGPWVTDWSEMAKKTAFRRATKWIPLSADIRDAFDRDDDTLDLTPPQRQAPQSVSDLSALLLSTPSPEAPQRLDHDPQAFQPDDSPADEAVVNQEVPDRWAECQGTFDACMNIDQCNRWEKQAMSETIGDGDKSIIAEMAAKRRGELQVAAKPAKQSQKNLAGT